MPPRGRITLPRARPFVAALALCLAACTGAAPPDAGYRTVAGGDAARGRLLLARYQCGACHEVPGTPTSGVPAGPPLDAFGGRSYIAGRVPNAPATLQRWLQQPAALVPGTPMPAVGVSAADARDIAAYLLGLE